VTALLEVLRCPVCGAELREAGAGLACTGCGREFPVENTILRLLDDSLPGMREKRAEIAGWVAKAQAESWYERNDEVDAVLPYICRELGIDDSDWRATEHSFSVLLDRYVEPGMNVLEVGAAKCWGAQHLIPRGCEYVGTDILADANIGLGRGAFYAERVGEFPRVQADAEHLPFADESFDLVYGVAALHHALDLSRMVSEMARVARRGGLVAALNEGTRAIGRSADAPAQRAERELGINEHVHTVWAYVHSFRRAGLRIRRVEHSDGEFRTRLGRVLKHVPKVGWTVASVLEQSLSGYSPVTLVLRRPGGYSGVSVYARKP
jgi:ubiquinone/menaquinone biosynthesis C-methylase UbiE/uncharacterized protein YbaR (Trm112 family)